MTPDERLREAVRMFIVAQQELSLCRCRETELANELAFRNLVETYRATEDLRPCINAAVEVEKDRSWFGWFQRGRKKR